MFNCRTHEEGLTLVELLVGVVAAIALPIVSNVLVGAQADADAASTRERSNFALDWSSAGADLTTSGGKVYAVIDGRTVAEISEGSAGGNGGGVVAAVTASWDGSVLGYSVNNACTVSSPDASFYYNSAFGGTVLMGTNSSGTFNPSVAGFPLGQGLGYGNTIASYSVAVACGGVTTLSDPVGG